MSYEPFVSGIHDAAGDASLPHPRSSNVALLDPPTAHVNPTASIVASAVHPRSATPT